MRRSSVAVMIAAFLLLVSIIWFWMRPAQMPEPLGPGGETSLPAADEEMARMPPEAAPPPADAEEPPVEAEAGEAELESEPLLRGWVMGDGAGIPGARVLLFSVRLAEDLLRRLERLAPEVRGVPDIPRVVAMLREELERVRTAAIEVRTGEDGSFELYEAAPGGYLLLTLASGWLFRYGDVVSLAAGETREIRIDLEHGAAIGGRVVAAGGSGLSGVTVVAEYRPPGAPGVGKLVRRVLALVNGEFLKGPFETRTGADGGFRLDSLPPGTYDLAAYTDERAESRLEGITTGAEDAVLVFGEPAAVDGFFVTTDGLPAASVTVNLERLESGAFLALPIPVPGVADVLRIVERYLGEGPRVASSDTSGYFRFGPVGAGSYRLSVDQKGFSPWSQAVSLEWSQSLHLGPIALDQGQCIRGIVLSEEGEPLAGARVIATLADGNFLTLGSQIRDLLTARAMVETQRDGTFVLRGLGPGQHRLTASCHGFAPAVLRSVASEGEPVELRLRRGASIAGIVVAAEGDEPVEGALVRARGGGGVVTRSDAEGRFLLEGVAPRDPEAENILGLGGGPFGPPRRREPAEEEGEGDPGRAFSIEVSCRGYASALSEVDLADPPEELRVELEEAPAISGVVLAPDGSPASGALVRLGPFVPPQARQLGFIDVSLIFFAVTVAQLDGTFRLDEFPAPAGVAFQITADHPLYARGLSDAFSLDDVEQEDFELRIELARPATVRGTVSDGAEPVIGAAVRLAEAPESERREMAFLKLLGLPPSGEVVHASGRGEFVFSKVLPGRYVISCELAGFLESPEERFEIEEGGTREFSFVLDRGGEMEGRVVDIEGTGLEGVRVRLLQEGADRQILDAQRFFGGAFKSGITGAEGLFRLDGLPPGRYTIIAERKGFRSASLQGVAPGDRIADLVLEPSGALAGRVVDLASGQPISSFRLAVRKEGEETPPFLRGGRRVTSAEGLFAEEDMEPGTYVVELRAEGYLPAETSVRVDAGARTEIEVAMTAAGRLRGRVVDGETGRPLPGARVSIARDQRPQTVVEEGAGRRVGEPRPGDEGSPAAGSEGGDLAAERPEDRDRRVMREFFRDEQLGETTATDESGGFVLESFPEGPQTIVVRHPDYIQAHQAGIEVPAGRELDLALQLRSGLEISGRVVDERGTPLAGRFLFLYGAGGGARKTAVSDPDGRFRMGGLEEGSYRLLLPRRGGESQQALDIRLTSDQRDLEIVASSEP